MRNAAGAARPVEPDDQRLWNLWRAFGEHLKGLRAQRGIDVRTLANQAGVGYATVFALERGSRTQDGRDYLPNPRDEVLGRLASAYGVALDDLIAFTHDSLQIGWYAERPQTIASHRGEALPGARDRGMDDLKRQQRRTDRLLELIADKLGVDLDELETDAEAEESSEPPRRRRKRPAG